MIENTCFTFNPFQENTYLLRDPASGEGIIVDPGNSNLREDGVLFAEIERLGVKPVMVVATHGHVDHVLGARRTAAHYGIPFAMHADDKFLLESAVRPGQVYGLSMDEAPRIDCDLSSRTGVRLGASELEVIPTPGHSPGHVCLFDRAGGQLWCGDTLFRESIGRTDLPGGDYSWIMRSILESILPLGEAVRLYPGHGPESTVGHEVLYNPFIVEVLNDEVNYRS